MYHIIYPKQGDRILQTHFSNASGLAVGIFLPLAGNRSSHGLHPHTWGRDSFNNSNCQHFNIEGTLLTLEGMANITCVAGAKCYTKPDYGSYKALFDRVMISKDYFSHFVVVGQDFDKTVEFYVPSSGKWIHYQYRFQIIWNDSVSYTRITRVYSRIVGGKVMFDESAILYLRYTPDFARATSLSIVKRGYTANVTKWIEPSPASPSSSTRYLLTGNSTLSINIKPAQIRAHLWKWRKEISSNDSSSFGQLSIDAVQALKVFDGQLSLLLRDLVGFKGLLLSFWTGLTSQTIKGLSSAYLSYHYGLRLTYRDLKDLADGFRSVVDGKRGYNSSRSRLQSIVSTTQLGHLETESTFSMKLYVRSYPDWIIDALQKMMVADFFPTLELAWDMIPFSFVVDWFVSIGDFLEMLDSRTLLSTYQVLSCMRSRRTTVRGSVGDILPYTIGKVFGELTITDYIRIVSRTPPPFRLDYTTPRSFNNYLEGAALIAQRSRV